MRILLSLLVIMLMVALVGVVYLNDRNDRLQQLTSSVSSGPTMTIEDAIEQGGGFTEISEREEYWMSIYIYPCDRNGEYDSRSAAGLGAAIWRMKRLTDKGLVEVEFGEISKANGGYYSRRVRITTLK